MAIGQGFHAKPSPTLRSLPAGLKREKKKRTRKSACDCAKSQPFIIYKPASIWEPVSETRCRYRFALRCYRVRGCTVAGRSGCSAEKSKKSSHPWHFRCWSPRRNELECTDLVHWPVALRRFSSRDATIFYWFCVRKALWRWFYPRSRKRDHFHRGTKAENLAWHSTG